MSQLLFKLNDKLGKVVHKVIFVLPSDEEGKMLEVCQRYCNLRKKEVTVGKYAFPFDPKKWVRQSGNRFIQYKNWNDCIQYGLYQESKTVQKTKVDPDVGEISYFVKEVYAKPNGKVLSSLELGVNKVGQIAAAIVSGSGLSTMTLILAVALLLAGLFGGVVLGYMGLPAIMGKELVPVATPMPSGGGI